MLSECASVTAETGKNFRKDNTTGIRGVYHWKCVYNARIGFQVKSYYLGNYSTIDEAKEARLSAEKQIFHRFQSAYKRYKEFIKDHPGWEKEHPFHFEVQQVGPVEFAISIEGFPPKYTI